MFQHQARGLLFGTNAQYSLARHKFLQATARIRVRHVGAVVIITCDRHASSMLLAQAKNDC